MAARLLVIDDEPGVTKLIEHAARTLGLEVMAINDTDQFEKAIDTFMPTIILLDVSMPGRDGVELIGHLAVAGYSARLAIMSGSDPRYIQMSSAIAKTRGLTVAGTLPKPFRMADVKALLRSLSSAPDSPSSGA